MDSELRFEIFYDKAGGYEELITALREYASRIARKWGVDYRFIEASEIDGGFIERLKADLRSIPPQVRGKIVTKRNRILPFSGSKNLNLKNTPIVVVYGQEGVAIDVYPHMFGTNYIDTLSFLRMILRRGPFDHFDNKGLLEDPIIKIVSDDPSIIEEGAGFREADVPTPTGHIDILLEDEQQTPMVVEVETSATDQAVGQVCRLASGYASMQKISPERLRKAVVFRSSTSNLAQTARGARVELYRLTCSRVV